jgi:hypothetical protein
MKSPYFIFLFVLLSCKSNVQKKSSASIKIDNSFRTSLDTVRIEYQYDTLIYSKEEFNEIADNFPELHEDIPMHPDIEYYKSGIFKDIVDKDGNQKHISFRSESGQDEFYMLYAYFLKKRNTYATAEKARNSLIEIFTTLNNIFGLLNNGGTYYGHQYKRIKGYAEYWAYWFGKENKESKTNDISKQKELFISSLKQEISAIIKKDNDFRGEKEKEQKARKLFAEADKLGSLLSNYFLLRRAQEFRYSYYQ